MLSPGQQQTLDDSFLPWSLLTVHIKSAVDLPMENRFSKSDAYVEVQFKQQRLQTDYIPNNNNPKWFQKFHFVVGQGTDD